ncbi:MAG: hypothetical protein GXO04_05640 [Aquificae bacterium]|nr:hypothetical protein [Aquificota bacterium]
MEVQTLVRSSEEINADNVIDFLKERYPEKYKLVQNWEELSGNWEVHKLRGDEYLIVWRIPDEEFKKEIPIFGSEESAKGAFLTTAQEHGWEEVPKRYVVYHAQFTEGGGKLLAGIKTEDSISVYDQLTLEDMLKKMSAYPRIVVYSSDVLTYIRDVYPDAPLKSYVIAREIAREAGSSPDLSELGKVYGIDTSTLEGALTLIEKLLHNPVKLPDGRTVNIRPYWYPQGV